MIKRFDIFGVYPKFYHEGKGIYQTYFGSILSLILLGSSIFAFIYYGKELIIKQDPSTIFSEEYTQSPEKYVFTQEKFSIALGLSNFSFDTTHYIDESIYQLYLGKEVLTKTLNDQGEELIDKQYFDIPLRRCKKSDFVIPQAKDYFHELSFLEHLYCINSFDDQEIDIEGDFGQNRYSTLQFQFKECQNSTESQVICKPKEDIDKILQNSYMAVYFSDNLVNPKNYTEPFQHIGRDAFSSVTNLERKSLGLYFKNVVIESNDGMIFDNSHSENALSYSSNYVQSYTVKEDGTFYNVVVRFEKFKTSRFFRSYLKLGTVLAQVGGILKIFFLLFWFLSYLFSSRDFDMNLLNQIFTFQYENPLNQSNKKSGKKNKNYQNQSVKDKKPRKSVEIQIKDFFTKMQSFLTISTIKSYFKVSMLSEEEQEQKELFNIAHQKLKKELDFTKVIKKLQEIDKIKQLLLNEDQIQLFEEISKPVVSKIDIGDIYQHQIQNQKEQEENQYVKEAQKLHPKKLTPKEIEYYKQELKFKKSFQSFQQVLTKNTKSVVDQKVLEMMNPKIYQKFLNIHDGKDQSSLFQSFNQQNQIINKNGNNTSIVNKSSFCQQNNNNNLKEQSKNKTDFTNKQTQKESYNIKNPKLNYTESQECQSNNKKNAKQILSETTDDRDFQQNQQQQIINIEKNFSQKGSFNKQSFEIQINQQVQEKSINSNNSDGQQGQISYDNSYQSYRIQDNQKLNQENKNKISKENINESQLNLKGCISQNQSNVWHQEKKSFGDSTQGIHFDNL